MGWAFNEEGPTIGDRVQPRCAFADEDGHECKGVLEWHHVIKQQRLKSKFRYGAYWSQQDGGGWEPSDRFTPIDFDEEECVTLDSIIADTRNRMWLCSEGAHEPVTNARLRVVVPESVWEFAREYGLVAMVENDLARQK
jgi:hypothetical protein